MKPLVLQASIAGFFDGDDDFELKWKAIGEKPSSFLFPPYHTDIVILHPKKAMMPSVCEMLMNDIRSMWLNKMSPAARKQFVGWGALKQELGAEFAVRITIRSLFYN